MIPLPNGPFCENYIVDDSPSPASASIRLCNFQTGRSELLEDHRTALRQWIMRPGYDTTHAWIDLVGYASKAPFRNNTGDNWTLSNARCKAVQDHLQEKFFSMFVKGLSGFKSGVVEGEGEFHRPGVVMGVGPSQSGADPTTDHNHGFYRAVLVRLFTQGDYKWKDIPVRRGHTEVASRRFEFEGIEFASSQGSVNRATIGANCLIFGIHDLTNRRRRYFWFGGLELGVATPKTPDISFSAEHNSKPVPFTTPVPFLDLEDFAGDGVITAEPGITFATLINVGGAMTLSWFPREYLNRGISTPVVINFSFSRGFGASLWSGGAGRVHILDANFRPTVYAR